MTSFSTRAGRVMLLATALAGSDSAVQAATPLYWPGSDFGYDRTIYDGMEPAPRRVYRQPRMPKEEAAKAEKLVKDAGKPIGPLVIAISLERQTMKVYDANGFFAETPISSGTKGHSTPMGVFSVIQKNKWHRSNLYSDAPMPFMQRLTWSGVALHAGVVPGYPASHGCVRMPMTFAVKMWSWTRMGARVVITPGEISPASLTHPFLASIKPAAAVPMAAAPVAPPTVNTKTADAGGGLPTVAVSDTSAGTPVPVTDKTAIVETPPAPKSSGPIAIFVSRKDAKLYVRQNFTPLFDVPITISGDQPLGTHVFTAYQDKDLSRPVQWTAMTLPASARMAEDIPSRRRQNASPVAPTPAVVEASAVDALSRLTLPDDVLARLGEQLTAGSSLVISDQGIAASGETGAGTDFIIRLR